MKDKWLEKLSHSLVEYDSGVDMIAHGTFKGKEYRVQKFFDQNSMSPYCIYYDEKGSRHEIWMENEQSLSEKFNVALENQLGGISFWRIGNGFDDLYQVLERAVTSK